MNAKTKRIGAHNRDMLAGSCCAFGVFDGVHKGHQSIIADMLKEGEVEGRTTCIITFDIDPDEILNPATHVKLMTDEDRLARLEELGPNFLYLIHCTRDLLARAPEEFLCDLFSEGTAFSMHVGSNFHFGYCAQGNLDTLQDWGNKHKMLVYGHSLIKRKGERVSASNIRALLAEGKVKEAAGFLGRPYRLRGQVEPGRGEGRKLGFRTANFDVPYEMRVLAEGVYAAWATVRGTRYKAAVSVGISPTFEQSSTARCEAHLIDFEGNIYGEELVLDFVCWIRPLERFKDNKELSDTVKDNIRWVKELLK